MSGRRRSARRSWNAPWRRRQRGGRSGVTGFARASASRSPSLGAGSKRPSGPPSKSAHRFRTVQPPRAGLLPGRVRLCRLPHRDCCRSAAVLLAPLRPPSFCAFASHELINRVIPVAVFILVGFVRSHARILPSSAMTVTPGYAFRNSSNSFCGTPYSLCPTSGRSKTVGTSCTERGL